jgi:hypothetical protein
MHSKLSKCWNSPCLCPTGYLSIFPCCQTSNSSASSFTTCAAFKWPGHLMHFRPGPLLIRQIVIVWSEWVEHDVACDQVDSKVAGLPLKHLLSVGLETGVQNYSRLEASFPRLQSKNLVRRRLFIPSFRNADWVIHSFAALILDGLRCISVSWLSYGSTLTAYTQRHILRHDSLG